MAQQIIRGGAPLDIPTAAETADAVDARHRAFWAEQRDAENARERELARGIKWMRIAVSDPLTPTSEVIPGPENGYAWKLRRFSAVLSAADSVSVYIGDAATARLIAFTASVTGQTNYVLGLSPEEILYAGETLFAKTSGTGHFASYYLSAWQVPAEMAWKLL